MLVSGDRKKKAVQTASALGLPVELIEESETYAGCDYIYPDNEKTVGVFRKVVTQWRMGFGGAVGLDYNPVFTIMQRSVPEEEWDTVFDGIRIMEGAALNVFREKNDKEK